jgi:hypothetical protein
MEIKALHEFLSGIAELGRNGDTMLAHITKAEAKKLEKAGGSGSRNPVTGLPEFFMGGDEGTTDSIGDALGDEQGNADSANSLGQGGFDYGNDALGGISDTVGTSAEDAQSISEAEDVTFDLENVMDLDQLSLAIRDMEETSFLESIGNVFGFGQTLGLTPQGQPETQNTFSIDPMGIAIGMAMGPIGSMAYSLGTKAANFNSPTAVSFNLSTGQFSMPNYDANAQSMEAPAQDNASDASPEKEEDPILPVDSPFYSAADISSDFGDTVLSILDQNEQESIFKFPDFQLLPQFNSTILGAEIGD